MSCPQSGRALSHHRQSADARDPRYLSQLRNGDPERRFEASPIEATMLPILRPLSPRPAGSMAGQIAQADLRTGMRRADSDSTPGRQDQAAWRG